MTIEEAKYNLDYCIRDMIEQKSHDDDKAIDIAVKSLEAWEKVKWDIKALADYNTVDVLVDVMRIINKHMGEVTT